MSDDIHIHIVEITGEMGVSRYEKKLPCEKCNWGHTEAEVTTDKIAEKVRQLRSRCRAVAAATGRANTDRFKGEMEGYYKVLSLISKDPNYYEGQP